MSVTSSTGRLLKMTEKGRLHQLSICRGERSRVQLKLNEAIYSLKQLALGEMKETEEVTTVHEQIQSLHKEFLTFHAKCLILVEAAEGASEEQVGESMDSEVKLINGVYRNWINSVQPRSSRSRSSRSSRSRSSHSKSSSLSSKLAQEKARLAELKVEQTFKTKLEMKRTELEAVKSNMEIEKAEAKVKIYEEELSGVAERDREIDAELAGIPQMDNAGFTERFVNSVHEQPTQQQPPVSDFISKLQPAAKEFVPDQIQPSLPEIWSSHHHPPTQGDNHIAELPLTSVPASTQQFLSSPNVPASTQQLLSSPNVPAPTQQLLPSTNVPASTQQFRPASNVPASAQHLLPKVWSTSNIQVSDIFKELQAPNVSLEVFSGSPMDYPFFMTNFVQAVEEKVKDERGRLARLIQYTDGVAQELVKSCIYLPTERCYQQAKKLLDGKFGDPFLVNAEYRKQLVSWPRLRANDVAAFTAFENFLIKYQSTVQAVGRRVDTSPELLQLLQTKLPPYLQDRWTRKVHRVRKEEGRSASLEDFIGGIKEETEIIGDPLFSRDAINELSKVNGGMKSRMKSLQTGTKEVCVCCEGFKHDLEKCSKFLRLGYKEKKNLIFKQRLCFACLAPSSQTHFGKNCTNPRTCGTCGGKHPTSLHTEIPIKTSFVNQSNAVGLSVVLVKVSHRENPGKSVTTLALLDNGSQGTFVSEELLTNLNLNGSKTFIEIHTVNGKSYQTCHTLSGLQISTPQNDCRINLPKVYSRSSLPIDAQDIPTAMKLKKWRYLHPILKHLVPDSCDLPVGILIGSNCPQVLEPLAVIQSQNNGPYATKTRLGWCVTGPMEIQAEGSVQCHRTSVRVQDSSHYFTFKETIKEVSIRESMLAMYNLDYYESTKGLALSIEDEKFLKIMKDGSLVDGKYCLPLPLRSPDKVVPNNRHQVINRANGLKKRLLMNSQMYNDYKDFMTTILDKGYAKLAESPPTTDRTWYIPHHGVYNPQKPGKIRVVFDIKTTA